MQRRYWKGLMIAAAILALVCTGALTGCQKKVPSEAGVKSTGTSVSQGTVQSTTPSTTASSSSVSEEPMGGDTGPEAVKPGVNVDEMRVRFNTENVHFAFDSSDLSPEAMAILKDKAFFLRLNPSKGVLIKGHCDERGSLEYNLALGDRRANSAKNFLTDLGIDARRINTISYGEEMPLDPASNEAAWAVNRRCEFALE
ncbi:OmpA family protein [Desulfatibacillum aliphaticivorans]|uniref:OmpA family protein n=1 Tax=Desulfatibacillum aliphaticivorans TaxID=218208 RepID=UPI00040B1893|nr:OmpA family protein [Desulfatibacillum aliphaticivorans]